MKLPALWRDQIVKNAYSDIFNRLYAKDVQTQSERYLNALSSFEQIFGSDRAVCFVSAPGRTELIGNHTDHQHGRVMAAAVTLDKIAVAAKREDGIVSIYSQGYPPDCIDTNDLEIKENEVNTSSALLRGVVAGFKNRGFHIGGFDAFVISGVPNAAGLSSSASYEVLLGTLVNHLYNDGRVDAVQIAQIGQYAENTYYQKPCGLMDQTASSVGGIVAIDFKNPAQPKVEEIAFSFAACGYTLMIVDAGGSHADLSDEYAAIPQEMAHVSALFGKSVLRDVDSAEFYDSIHTLRKKVSDRALLRAIHYFEEDARVQQQIAALKNGDIDAFKNTMISSGKSSALNLQNTYPSNSISERSVALALAISERELEGLGAWRVHGGGFAGTILALVPDGRISDYTQAMERAFGEGCCQTLYIRPVGGYVLEDING